MKRLDSYFLEYNEVDEETPHSVFYMNPEQLLNPRRIDIVAKYYYIKAREKGENLKLAIELYRKHIEAFSDGTFSEPGNSKKSTFDDYLTYFDKMIDSFKSIGFDESLSIIPVGKNLEILDGSHRAACALYFKEEVKVMCFESLSVDYGFEFFKKRLLDDFYIDIIAKEYVRLKKNVQVLFVWPRIATETNVRYVDEQLVRDGFNIIYEKKMKLDEKDLWNLVFNIYREEHWVGSTRDDFKGLTDKRDSVFDRDGYLKLYILDYTSVEELTKAKEKLRKHFKIDKSSLHSIDTSEESMKILDILLERNFSNLLYENFSKAKDRDYSILRTLKRKIRYNYRLLLNETKKILRKPV